MRVTTKSIGKVPAHLYTSGAKVNLVLDIKDASWSFSLTSMHDKTRPFKPFSQEHNNESIVALRILGELLHQTVTAQEPQNPSWVNIAPVDFFTEALNSKAALEWSFGSLENAQATYNEFSELLRQARIQFYNACMGKKFISEPGVQINRDGTGSVEFLIVFNPTGNVVVQTVG